MSSAPSTARRAAPRSLLRALTVRRKIFLALTVLTVTLLVVFIGLLRWGLHRTRVKACLGVVQLQPSLETVDSVLAAATLACAEAKAAGGDSVRVFVPTEMPEAFSA